MSRSIHQNASWQYWQQHGPHGAEDWEARFKKSRIKRSVRIDRKSPRRLFTPIPAEAIRYSVEELGPSLFFPATLADVKGVMNELQPGFLNGVTQVRFEAGREYINDQESIVGQVFDPLGRKSVEIAPGLYAPILLGAFSPDTGAIQLFAYALHPSAELSEDDELGLRAYMLKTLVHELAHNEDVTRRVARGRWRVDDTEKAEAYADRVTRELFDSVVMPYLKRVCGSE